MAVTASMEVGGFSTAGELGSWILSTAECADAVLDPDEDESLAGVNLKLARETEREAG